LNARAPSWKQTSQRRGDSRRDAVLVVDEVELSFPIVAPCYVGLASRVAGQRLQPAVPAADEDVGQK
jgi:hypothetical protein